MTLNAATGVISGKATGTGVDTFTLQARDVNGNIGSRSYTLDPRPDPALDPQVQGLILSQVATAQRFASTQVTNITRHMEGLHDHFTSCGFNFGIAPPISGAQPQFGAPYGQGYYDLNALYSPNEQYGSPAPSYARQGYAEERAPSSVSPFAYASADPVTTGANLSFPPQPNQPQRQPQRLPPCSSDWMTSMAFWTSGSFQFETVTPNGVTDSNRFNTSGRTVGIDIRPTDSLIVGIAAGYGADRSDIGSSGSRSNSTSLSGALYDCMSLFNPFFLDAAIGYGTLNYDNRRFVIGDSTFADGTRKGSYWYGALKGSAELVRGNVKITPYVSVDFTSTTLDSYGEQGSSAQLLTYDAMKFTALSGTVGLRGAIDIPMSFGILTPNARVEYRQTSQSSFDQSVYYTDLGSGSSSTFGQAIGVRNLTTGSLDSRARSPGGLGVELEYSMSIGTDSYQSQTIRGAVRVPF